jgi:hypothetical protein
MKMVRGDFNNQPDGCKQTRVNFIGTANWERMAIATKINASFLKNIGGR